MCLGTARAADVSLHDPPQHACCIFLSGDVPRPCVHLVVAQHVDASSWAVRFLVSILLMCLVSRGSSLLCACAVSALTLLNFEPTAASRFVMRESAGSSQLACHDLLAQASLSMTLLLCFALERQLSLSLQLASSCMLGLDDALSSCVHTMLAWQIDAHSWHVRLFVYSLFMLLSNGGQQLPWPCAVSFLSLLDSVPTATSRFASCELACSSLLCWHGLLVQARSCMHFFMCIAVVFHPVLSTLGPLFLVIVVDRVVCPDIGALLAVLTCSFGFTKGARVHGTPQIVAQCMSCLIAPCQYVFTSCCSIGKHAGTASAHVAPACAVRSIRPPVVLWVFASVWLVHPFVLLHSHSGFRFCFRPRGVIPGDCKYPVSPENPSELLRPTAL